MHDFGPDTGLGRAPHDPIGLAADGIGQRRVGERKLIIQERMIFMLARISARLGECEIDEGAAGSGHHWENCVEHLPVIQVLVEPEMHEIAQHPPALRDTKTDRVAYPAADRVHRRGIVPQKRHQIADRRETDAHDLRVLGGIDEFINRPAVEAWWPGDRDVGGVDIVPGQARRRGAAVLLALADSQARFAWGEIGGLIRQCADERRLRRFLDERVSRAESLGDEFVAIDAVGGDAGEMRIQAICSRGDTGLPRAPDHREPVPHQEAIPGMGRSRRAIAVGTPVKTGQRDLVAAVGNVVQQPAVSPPEIGWRHQREVRAVLYPSGGIMRRLVQVDDRCIQRV